MQAMVSTKRFGSGRFGTLAVALGFAAGLALGTAGPAVVDNLASLSRNETTASRPVAYSSAGQGEGWLAHGRPREAGIIKAPGEGIVGSVGYDRMRYLEQNLYLPGGTSATPRISYADIRFLEQNLYLPGDAGRLLPPSPGRIAQPQDRVVSY